MRGPSLPLRHPGFRFAHPGYGPGLFDIVKHKHPPLGRLEPAVPCGAWHKSAAAPTTAAILTLL